MSLPLGSALSRRLGDSFQLFPTFLEPFSLSTRPPRLVTSGRSLVLKGGEKQHVFQDGLLVKSYEDFMENAIGGVVTRASRDLVAWCLSAPLRWREQHTLELGAGCGLVSSALLRLGACVVATDLSELLPHLEYNLSLNATGEGQWRVRALNWESESDRSELRAEMGAPDAIFAANCTLARSM